MKDRIGWAISILGLTRQAGANILIFFSLLFFLAARKREREAADEEARRTQQDDRVPLLDLLSWKKRMMMVR